MEGCLMKDKKRIVIVSLFVVALLGVIGISFALWNKTFVQNGENIVESDCFKLTFTETDAIVLEDSFPMYDKDGMKLTPYTFTIENTCDNEVDYQLNFETKNTTTLPNQYVKFQFQEENPVLLNTLEPTSVTIKNGKNAYKLEEGRLKSKEVKNYSLRIWMAENVTQNSEGAMNSTFEGIVTIKASYITNYYESLLNGNDPVIKEPLIPVTITNENGENIVRKADTHTKWYKYEEHEWANAIILKDENESYYNGEEIPEDKIESYFVWIPKFDYVIFNTTDYLEATSVNSGWDASKHAIQIRFSTKSTTDTSTECKSPNKSGDIGTCEVGKWMTHPAFVDGFEGIKGMWVGKFETSRDTTVSTKENETKPEAIQIKPNITSWRNIQLANAFYSTYDYKKNLDSHMMKNTEWGAVAYFTHSIYGRCTSLTNCSEVRINNNSNYITGYAGVHNPTTGYTGTNISCTITPEACNEYGTTNDVTRPWNDIATLGLASTTGNITGIYDVSGGSWEYMMGVMMDDRETLVSGRNSAWNSNFIGTLIYPNDDPDTANRTKITWTQTDGGVPYPENKYFDLYNYSTTDSNYERRILGDATGEMGPFQDKNYGVGNRRISSWNDDESRFATSNPWFDRSGRLDGGTGAGVFAFNNSSGGESYILSFRVVLSPMS